MSNEVYRNQVPRATAAYNRLVSISTGATTSCSRNYIDTDNPRQLGCIIRDTRLQCTTALQSHVCMGSYGVYPVAIYNCIAV